MQEQFEAKTSHVGPTRVGRLHCFYGKTPFYHGNLPQPNLAYTCWDLQHVWCLPGSFWLKNFPVSTSCHLEIIGPHTCPSCWTRVREFLHSEVPQVVWNKFPVEEFLIWSFHDEVMTKIRSPGQLSWTVLSPSALESFMWAKSILDLLIYAVKTKSRPAPIVVVKKSTMVACS